MDKPLIRSRKACTKSGRASLAFLCISAFFLAPSSSFTFPSPKNSNGLENERRKMPIYQRQRILRSASISSQGDRVGNSGDKHKDSRDIDNTQNTDKDRYKDKYIYKDCQRFKEMHYNLYHIKRGKSTPPPINKNKNEAINGIKASISLPSSSFSSFSSFSFSVFASFLLSYLSSCFFFPLSTSALESKNICRSTSNAAYTLLSCERYGVEEIRSGKGKGRDNITGEREGDRDKGRDYIYDREKIRLYPCRSGENCLSTFSVNNPQSYRSPWKYTTAEDAYRDKYSNNIISTTQNTKEAKDKNEEEKKEKEKEPIPSAFFDLVNVLQNQEGFRIREIDSKNLYIHATAPTSSVANPPFIFKTQGKKEIETETDIEKGTEKEKEKTQEQSQKQPKGREVEGRTILSPISSSDQKLSSASSQKTNLDDIEFLFNPKEGIVSYRVASRQSIFIYPLQQPIQDRKVMDQRLKLVKDQLGWISELSDYQEYGY